MKRINLINFLIPCTVLALIFLENGVSAQPALGTTSFENTTGTISLVPSGECSAGRSATLAGYTIYLRSAVNCAVNNPMASPSSDGHINLITTPASTGIWQEGRILSTDGSAFQLNSIVLSALTTPFVGKTITFSGYLDNTPVAGATLVSSPFTATGLANQLSVDFSGNAGFDNIDEIRMTPSGTDAQGTISIHSITISEANDPLPLFFTGIKADESQEGIQLVFKTASEDNVDAYDIQLSRDASAFQTVERIAAKKGEVQEYKQTITTHEPGSFWIRVKARLLNHSVSYSPIVMVSRKGKNDLILYPNVARDAITILNAVHPTYRIFDLSGKTLQSGLIENQQIRISRLPAGLLFLKIDGKSYKIIKQ